MKNDLEHLSDCNEIVNEKNNGLEKLNPTAEDLAKLEKFAADLKPVDITKDQVQKQDSVSQGKKNISFGCGCSSHCGTSFSMTGTCQCSLNCGNSYGKE